MITDPAVFNQGNRPFSRELAINRFAESFQYSDYVLHSDTIDVDICLEARSLNGRFGSVISDVAFAATTASSAIDAHF